VCVGGVVTVRMLRRLRTESGMTLVELGVGMAITALLSTLMVSWLAAGIGSETSHRSYDEALSDLRHVTDQLSREIRTSNGVKAFSDHSVSLWLDGNRDDVVDDGEIVTWEIEGTAVLRYTDNVEDGAVLATNVSSGASVFTFDADDPAEVTRVTVTLVTVAETRAGRDPIEHTVDIYLRNV
jgi:type II secretory pathway pseudopilin PulG